MTKMKEVTPFHLDICLHMKGYMNRPPMERTDTTGSLYHLAQLVALEELDLHLSSCIARYKLESATAIS
ncbi:hypothetical protein [Paenibacillus taiwanensis]|uniref:hypothetical protein n=1 Tax=Paenibacillus taiwanensis TaxID=401638 RepID=UPI0012FA8A99|nr:hypothetical protein [Paenibacillus taiwanensis]